MDLSEREQRQSVHAVLVVMAAHSGDYSVIEQACAALCMLCLGQTQSKSADEHTYFTGSEEEAEANLQGEGPEVGADGGQLSSRKTTRPSNARRPAVRSLDGSLSSSGLAALCVDTGAIVAVLKALKDARHEKQFSMQQECMRALKAMVRSYGLSEDTERCARQEAMIDADGIIVLHNAMIAAPKSEGIQKEGAATLFHMLEGTSQDLADPETARQLTEWKELVLKDGIMTTIIQALTVHDNSAKVQCACLRLLTALVSRGAPTDARLAVGEAVSEACMAMTKFTWHKKLLQHALRLVFYCCEANDKGAPRSYRPERPCARLPPSLHNGSAQVVHRWCMGIAGVSHARLTPGLRRAPLVPRRVPTPHRGAARHLTRSFFSLTWPSADARRSLQIFRRAGNEARLPPGRRIAAPLKLRLAIAPLGCPSGAARADARHGHARRRSQAARGGARRD